MLNIEIKTIPQKQQRYPTIGDWIINQEEQKISIFVTDMGNWKFEFLVALHELIEAMYCEAEGIPQKAVDEFDLDYEANREKGDLSEPGDSHKAPYFKQHKFASFVERVTALEMKIGWDSYEKTINLVLS